MLEMIPTMKTSVPKRGKKAEHVALSHCWGGEITPKLEEKTLEDFKVKLPFCDLPANVKDAIKVTRKLGIRCRTRRQTGK